MRIRLKSPTAKLVVGQHVEPGEVIDCPDHVAQHFLRHGEAELVDAESVTDSTGPDFTHRDPKVTKKR